jgi:hypothetical protein
MLSLHFPASKYRCGYCGNFLVCSVQVLPLEGLLIGWGLKWPGQRGGEDRKEGRGTEPLKFRVFI